MSTNPTVCFVESLGFLEEQSLREGEIISKTLQLSGKRSAYVYIRTVEELTAIAHEFGESGHRYLHLSAHARTMRNTMVGLALTTGDIENVELAKILAPHLEGRRLFLSSCFAARSGFAKELLKRSGCLSVLAPMNEIKFDDAAIFWTAFYHLMFKARRHAMSNARIIKTVGICATLVDERFRLFTPGKRKGTVDELTIGPVKDAQPTIGDR